MRGKKIAAILLAGIIVINDCVTFLPALSQNVYAAGNYDSTNAQLYHETTVVSDYNDGSARWSYRLNKATKEGYVDNITDLKFKESVNGSTEITIPSTINGVAVTELGKDAFANNTKLTAIKIPKTVTRICDKAFWGCKNLTTVSFEDANSVGVLGERAFSGCCKLTSIVLGADLMKDDTTGNYAFEDCESLENVVINNTQAVSIQEGTFDGCSKLKDVSLFTSSPAKSFHIGKYAFRNTLVETMNFNVPVTVDEGAFYGCKKLSSVYFKKSAIIGVSAFSNAFEKNSAIPEKKVTFYGVTNTLGESSFDGCTGITALEFSDNNSVINIGKNCFNGTSSLNEIEFKGKNVNTSIYAFNGMCASKVTFSNTERTEIAGDLFEKDNLYCNSICFNSKNVYLASYEQTANKVFSHAKKLKDVYFLNNVSTINATINGDIYFSNMYFYNPNISGIITDNSTVAYNVYGYWKKDDEDIKETLYKGTSSLRKYVDLQKALEVEYTGPSTILVGTLIDSSKIKVSNILFDDSKEAVTYSRDNTKYTGYVIEQNNLSNTGKQKIKVSYWNCSDAFDINVVTPTPLPTEKPIVTGVVEVSPTGKPGDKEGAVTGTPAVTQPVITITPTIKPTRISNMR